jgi:hypothetical protein
LKSDTPASHLIYLELESNTKTKVCSRCKEERNIELFSKNKRKKDGIDSICKICVKEKSKNYYNNNREKVLEKQRSYNDENKEKRLAYSKKTKEERKEYKKEYYEKNRDSLLAYAKEYRKNNREKALEYQREYTKSNREYIAKRDKWYKENNKEYTRMKRLKMKFNLSIEEYEEIYNEQRGVCAICGKQETHANSKTGVVNNLCVDHNHETGVVRGLLCNACNTSLGKMNDDIDILKSAICYLEKNKSQ